MMRKRLLSDIFLLVAILACIAVLVWATVAERNLEIKVCNKSETIGEMIVIGERVCPDGGTDE
jgi:hypothetical protein